MAGKTSAPVSTTALPPAKKRKSSTVSLVLLVVQQHVAAEDIVDASKLVAQTDLHSATKARLLFTWLLYPVTPEEFYEKYWEQRPLVIKRDAPSYYDSQNS